MCVCGPNRDMSNENMTSRDAVGVCFVTFTVQSAPL